MAPTRVVTNRLVTVAAFDGHELPPVW